MPDDLTKRATGARRGMAALKLVTDTALENGWEHKRSWGLETYTRSGHRVEVDLSRTGRIIGVWGDNTILPITTRSQLLDLLREPQ